jgi:hypothetical protein
MVQELEDYKDKIKSLEEEVKFYKGDRTNIIEFRICASEVRKEFQDSAKQAIYRHAGIPKIACSDNLTIGQS